MNKATSRALTIILFALAGCATCFGQISYKGLTPGRSTKADVEQTLGQPTGQEGETLFVYGRGGKEIYVQYSKRSPTAIRIEVVHSPPGERAAVLSAQGLPQEVDARRTNEAGLLEEYFGDPKYIVLTYEENSQTKVGQVGYYSRELFESRTGIRAEARTSLSGRWFGSWTNSKGESGKTAVIINEQDTGAITGDEGGWVIENGRRSGNVLTWEYHNKNNGCRDYTVRWEISSDGKMANGTYKAVDRCEKQTYTGTYLNYRR